MHLTDNYVEFVWYQLNRPSCANRFSMTDVYDKESSHSQMYEYCMALPPDLKNLYRGSPYSVQSEWVFLFLLFVLESEGVCI